MGSSSRRVKTKGNKRKEPERLPRFYSHRFLFRKHEEHIQTVQERRLLMVRKAIFIPNLAPQFGVELESRYWEKLATYPAPANIEVVKEFSINGLFRGLQMERYNSYSRGEIIIYDPKTINSFLGTEWAGEQCQFALNIRKCSDYDDIERVLCIHGGHFYKNPNGVRINIKRADLTPLPEY